MGITDRVINVLERRFNLFALDSRLSGPFLPSRPSRVRQSRFLATTAPEEILDFRAQMQNFESLISKRIFRTFSDCLRAIVDRNKRGCDGR